MWPFSQTAVAEAVEPVVHDSFLRETELRLMQIQREYEQAEKAFSEAHLALFGFVKTNPDSRSFFLNRKLFCRVNAMGADPERTQLESNHARAVKRRNDLLSERATLLRSLGRVK